MGLQFFLIDFENVQPTDIGSLLPGSCRIMMFLGQNQSKVPVTLSQVLQPFGADVEYLQISGSGPNAVDFHIAFYIGRLAASHPDARFTIVSKDTGFDPLVKHLASLKIVCHRAASIGGSVKLPSPKTVPVTKGTAAKTAVAAKPKPAKNVIVTIVPEANGKAIKSKPAISHVAEVVKRLKGLKSAKPATLKTLQSSMKSWFNPALKPDEVVSVIAALQDLKKISVNGTKVVYTLG
ncbi:MAG: PIN domain-containing protein [Rhodanobacter sp.]